MDPSPDNPYQAPRLTDASDEDVRHRCSFCGRDTVAIGPLVQSPDKRAYICQSCAEIAQQLITTHHAPRGAIGRLTMAVMGAVLLVGILFSLLYTIKSVFGGS